MVRKKAAILVAWPCSGEKKHDGRKTALKNMEKTAQQGIAFVDIEYTHSECSEVEN